jgi:hypothetical protein
MGQTSARRNPGLLTWSEISCDVENSKSFRSSRDRRIFPGHRLKGASALHNHLASIFTAPGVTTWSDMSGNTRKNQVTRLVTLRNRSIMSGALKLRGMSAHFRACPCCIKIHSGRSRSGPRPLSARTDSPCFASFRRKIVGPRSEQASEQSARRGPPPARECSRTAAR